MSNTGRNWPSDELLRSVDRFVVGMVLWLANFLYGGIHAVAWNNHFPSVAEKWLWRASAIYIGFCGGLWVVPNFLVKAYRPLNDFWERWMDGEKGVVPKFDIGQTRRDLWIQSDAGKSVHCHRGVCEHPSAARIRLRDTYLKPNLSPFLEVRDIIP